MTITSTLQYDFPLQHHNTFGIVANAYACLSVTGLADLQALRHDAVLAALPRLVLGGGSNLVLRGDFPGLVIWMRGQGISLAGEDSEWHLVRAAAGERWHDLVMWTLAQGYGGLENLALIPGSVGAAPIQNIGAYGAELKDCFHSATVYEFDSGAVRTLGRDDCAFGYRDSIFKQALHGRFVILDVTFALPKAWKPNLAYGELAQEVAAALAAAAPELGQDGPAGMRRSTGAAAGPGGRTLPDPQCIGAAVMAIRRRKLPDPAVTGNAGSFFKNPLVGAGVRESLLACHPDLVSYRQEDGRYKLAAGWLIERCGWKGKRLGRAGVYEKQALVLVNHGGASGAEVMALAAAIQADVQQRFGVLLEPEPVLV